jgi:hypothetical protein
MSTEEPAWKAELRRAVLDAVNTSEDDYDISESMTPTTDAVMAAVGPHIQAAEERGRQEAATARSYAARWAAEDEREPLGRVALSFALGHLRDLLDPDKT